MKNFFKGLSFSQLFAGALAAVTSFLLSSKIGIAGSVIGVAVASIVSTAASQIYKNVLDESSRKLQDAAQNQLGLPGAGDKDAADDGTAPTDSTQQLPAVDAEGDERIGRTVSSSRGVRAGDGPTAPQMSRRNKRTAIIVAVVSALVAVGATAGIILALTDGQGTDSVVRDIVHPSVTTDEGTHGDRVITPTPTDGATQSTPDATQQPTPSQSTTQQPGSSSTDGQQQNGQGDTSSGTDSGDGSGSGSDTGQQGSDTGQQQDGAGTDAQSGQNGTQSDTTQRKDDGQQTQ